MPIAVDLGRKATKPKHVLNENGLYGSSFIRTSTVLVIFKNYLAHCKMMASTVEIYLCYLQVYSVA